MPQLLAQTKLGDDIDIPNTTRQVFFPQEVFKPMGRDSELYPATAGSCYYDLPFPQAQVSDMTQGLEIGVLRVNGLLMASPADVVVTAMPEKFFDNVLIRSSIGVPIGFSVSPSLPTFVAAEEGASPASFGRTSDQIEVRVGTKQMRTLIVYRQPNQNCQSGICRVQITPSRPDALLAVFYSSANTNSKQTAAACQKQRKSSKFAVTGGRLACACTGPLKWPLEQKILKLQGGSKKVGRRRKLSHHRTIIISGSDWSFRRRNSRLLQAHGLRLDVLYRSSLDSTNTTLYTDGGYIRIIEVNISGLSWSLAQDACPPDELCTHEQLCKGTKQLYAAPDSWNSLTRVPVANAPEQWIYYPPASNKRSKNTCKIEDRLPANRRS